MKRDLDETQRALQAEQNKPKPKEKSNDGVNKFFAFERFESNFNSDVSSYLMLRNPKAKQAQAPAQAAPAPVAAKPGKKKK